jgi:hypothetical protein
MIMVNVTIEIDDKYAGVLSLTAIGSTVWQTMVTATAVDLSQYNRVSIDENGKITMDMQPR